MPTGASHGGVEAMFAMLMEDDDDDDDDDPCGVPEHAVTAVDLPRIETTHDIRSVAERLLATAPTGRMVYPKCIKVSPRGMEPKLCSICGCSGHNARACVHQTTNEPGTTMCQAAMRHASGILSHGQHMSTRELATQLRCLLTAMAMLWHEQVRLTRLSDRAPLIETRRQLATILYIYQLLVTYVAHPDNCHREYFHIRGASESRVDDTDAIMALPFMAHVDRQAFRAVVEYATHIARVPPAIPTLDTTSPSLGVLTLGVFHTIPPGSIPLNGEAGPAIDWDAAERRFIESIVDDTTCHAAMAFQGTVIPCRYPVHSFPSSCSQCFLLRHCKASCATRTPALHVAICLATMIDPVNRNRILVDVQKAMLWNVYVYIRFLAALVLTRPAEYAHMAEMRQLNIGDIRCTVSSPAPILHLARLYNHAAMTLAPYLGVNFAGGPPRDEDAIEVMVARINERGSGIPEFARAIGMKLHRELCRGGGIETSKQDALVGIFWNDQPGGAAGPGVEAVEAVQYDDTFTKVVLDTRVMGMLAQNVSQTPLPTPMDAYFRSQYW
jgi:hypothetical protein